MPNRDSFLTSSPFGCGFAAIAMIALASAGCSRNATSAVTTADDVARRDITTQSRHAASDDGVIRDSRGGGQMAGGCGLDNVYFAYDQSDLDSNARAQLTRNATCITSTQPRSVAITGMADPRGTTEYNLGLGDRRARAAARFLSLQGVAPEVLQVRTVGKEFATGTDEETWAQDRRAEFETE